MKKITIVMFCVLLLLSCQQKRETKSSTPKVKIDKEILTETVQESEKFVCINYNFLSLQKQADSLVSFYTKALKSDSLTRPV